VAIVEVAEMSSTTAKEMPTIRQKVPKMEIKKEEEEMAV
jgi:hypothetical protein